MTTTVDPTIATVDMWTLETSMLGVRCQTLQAQAQLPVKVQLKILRLKLKLKCWCHSQTQAFPFKFRPGRRISYKERTEAAHGLITGRSHCHTPRKPIRGVWLLNNVRMRICKILPTSGKVQYVHSAAWSSDFWRY